MHTILALLNALSDSEELKFDFLDYNVCVVGVRVGQMIVGTGTGTTHSDAFGAFGVCA